MLFARPSKDEIELLEEHYRSSQTRLVRERAHALLLSSDGESVPHIARILRRTEKTVRTWIHTFGQQRLASLFTSYTQNINASKLSKAQREEIQQTLAKPPSEVDISKAFWSVRDLRSYLKASFRVVYESERSYHFLLKLSNLSFKLPSSFDIRRNDTYVVQQMEEIHAEIKLFLAEDSWEVLVSDEVRIVLESELRRAWLRRGEKTVVR